MSSRRPLAFFALVFALSIPFLVVGAVTRLELLPGLPVAALMIFAPLAAAVMLVYREEGPAGVATLLQRAIDFGRIRPAWYLPIVLLMPGVALVSYGVMRWMRIPVPEPEIPLAGAVGMALAFFAAALAEEVGWSGYATDPLQARWGALGAAVLIGVAWAVWHLVPLAQAHRTAGWMAWWGLGTVGSRILIVWIYNNTGKSIAAAALYHAMGNLCWQLFPKHGSHYDPRVTSLLIVSAAAIVIILWGPRTLQNVPHASGA
jgi:hypothetical protein